MIQRGPDARRARHWSWCGSGTPHSTTEDPTAVDPRVLRSLAEAPLLGHSAGEWRRFDLGVVWLIRMGESVRGEPVRTFRWTCTICDCASFATFLTGEDAGRALLKHHREGYCRGHKEGALLP